MEEQITVDMLTQDSVSIKRQRYIIDANERLDVGLPHRCAYVNSAKGRVEIAVALAEPYLSAVMSIWGDVPTVEEPTT